VNRRSAGCKAPLAHARTTRAAAAAARRSRGFGCLVAQMLVGRLELVLPSPQHVSSAQQRHSAGDEGHSASGEDVEQPCAPP
jgi:hypothetical protein